VISRASINTILTKLLVINGGKNKSEGKWF